VGYSLAANRAGDRAGVTRVKRGRLAWLSLVPLAMGAVVLVLWPRNDVPRDPDAVIVLGGAGYERIDLGIELRERYDAVLVLSASAVRYGAARGFECGRDAICLGPTEWTTAGEARAAKQLLDAEGWDHITVATGRFHTTRARLLFRQCLGERVTVVGAPPYPGDDRRGLHSYVAEASATVAALTVRRAC
jgi:uncharacterized SAM-binding protein YcdF (DUF218 family)